MVFIRSLKKEKERGSEIAIWWMANRNGYTDELMKAGLYNEDTAADVIADGTPGGNIAVNIDLARERMDEDGYVKVSFLPSVD